MKVAIAGAGAVGRSIARELVDAHLEVVRRLCEDRVLEIHLHGGFAAGEGAHVLVRLFPLFRRLRPELLVGPVMRHG